MAVDTASAEPPEELSPLIEALERARLRASAATALREALESEVWQLWFELLEAVGYQAQHGAAICVTPAATLPHGFA